MTVNITWLSASSAPQVTSSWLNVSFSDLNWLANISAVVSALLSLPTAWSYERFGIKWNLLVAAFINVIGCWIRFISNFVPVHSRFWVVMLGQSIASISGPLVTNISTKLAAVWFAPKHRGIANTLTALSIAPAIAPIVIPIIAPVPENTPQMFLITAVFASIVAIIFPFLPHKPKIPPSFSATQSRTSVWEGMKMLVKNRDFIWLLIISSTGIGMASCFTVIIMEAIIPYGYTEQQAGLCVAVITISGFFGGGVTGYWLGKSNDPNTIIRMFTPLTIFSYVMFIYQIVPNAFSVLLIACVANGFFSYGLFNVYLELASEVTYPVPESVSSCCIAAGNSVTTFLFTVILDAFRAGPKAHPPHHMNTSLIVATIIVIVGSLPCLVLKGELKRLAVDQQLNQCKK
ncbi:major facilitator superfamily domain-containing protein [Cunninghamella echinulata]|nr:major facilitator superfamily domain-containing protein [Cunninghamella echinulata]